MSWYNIAEAPANKVKFPLIDFSYYPAFLHLFKKTKRIESFASYINRKENILREFMKEDEKKIKADFGYDYFANSGNFLKYIKEIKHIIKEVNKYKKEYDILSKKGPNRSEIIKLFKKAKNPYHKSLGLYLMTQPEYTSKIEIEIKKDLSKHVSSQEINDIFITITSSERKSCLDTERLNWLKNIVIPAINNYKNYLQAKKSIDLRREIDKHIKKYKYYSAGIEFDLWDNNHYLKILKDDFNSGVDKVKKELSEINNRYKSIKNKKKSVFKKYNFDENTIKMCQLISELGVIRVDLRILGWQFFNYLIPLLIDKSIKILKLQDVKEIDNLSYDEFINILNNPSNIKKVLEKKKYSTNILIIITNKQGYRIYRGKEADKVFRQEIYKECKKVRKFQGVVANKGGIIKGKVSVFKWGSNNFNKKIYSFPNNYILVAGQTKPLLMPAIRKAKAIITDEGGVLCHAAIVSRELNVPCIIGTKIATKLLEDGDLVEVNTNNGVIKIIK